MPIIVHPSQGPSLTFRMTEMYSGIDLFWFFKIDLSPLTYVPFNLNWLQRILYSHLLSRWPEGIENSNGSTTVKCDQQE